MKKPMKTYGIPLLLALLWVGSSAWATPKVRYSSPEGQILVIGDIHGDFKALIQILYANKLINDKGKWKGGTRQIVIDGDFVGKGNQSYETAYFLMNLQKLAASAGGRVHITPGNHELRILRGDTSSLSKRDRKLFKADYRGGAKEAFSKGPLGTWFRNTPMVLSIDRSLISHADPDHRLAEAGLSKANGWFSSWVRFYQERGKEPPSGTKWVVDLRNKGGPLGNRQLVHQKVSPQDLGTLLERLKVDRIIVGHTPTKSGQIETMYGGRVIRVDTGISSAMGGNLSSLELRKMSDKVRRAQKAALKKKVGRREAKRKSSPRDLPPSVVPNYPNPRKCKAYRNLKPKS